MTRFHQSSSPLIYRTGKVNSFENRLQKQKEPQVVKTTKSVGGTIGKFAIFELAQPSPHAEPCFAFQAREKPLAFLREIEDANARLKFKPESRVPWPLPREPQNYGSTEQLFNEIKDCLYLHLETPEPSDLTIIASWVMMSWQNEKYETIPYLFFFGAMESGKSRALEILQQLCFRAWISSNVTPASIYRTIEQWKPTLLVDESESFIGLPEVIALLNSGYKRGLIIPRQVLDQNGNYETAWFEVFSPKAIAGTADLVSTLRSRCIMFKMHKCTREIPIFLDKELCANLRDKLLKWRFDNALGVDSEGSVGFSDKAGRLEQLGESLGSGRLSELFFPLYDVCPEKYRTEILEYARKARSEQIQELGLTSEVNCLASILQCHKAGMVQNGLLLFQDITNVRT
jgi:hypothetical protein